MIGRKTQALSVGKKITLYFLNDQIIIRRAPAANNRRMQLPQLRHRRFLKKQFIVISGEERPPCDPLSHRAAAGQRLKAPAPLKNCSVLGL